jgi:hypothetical protein
MMKFLTMGTTVSMMGLNMMRVGVAVNTPELVIFPAITLVNIGMVTILLKNVDDQGGNISQQAEVG